jgi:hypothetical protein
MIRMPIGFRVYQVILHVFTLFVIVLSEIGQIIYIFTLKEIKISQDLMICSDLLINEDSVQRNQIF